MAFRVEFTELAADDLEGIAVFIGQDNPQAASRICRSLFDLALSLRKNPFLGRASPEFHDPVIRDLVKGNYRIVYEIDAAKDQIRILRIWHGARGYLHKKR